MQKLIMKLMTIVNNKWLFQLTQVRRRNNEYKSKLELKRMRMEKWSLLKRRFRIMIMMMDIVEWKMILHN